jgi:hypothetical protein
VEKLRQCDRDVFCHSLVALSGGAPVTRRK